MKNSLKNFFATMAVGVFFASLGFCSSGCDATTTDSPEATTDAGISSDSRLSLDTSPTNPGTNTTTATATNVATTVSCAIPESTAPASPGYFVRVTNDTRAACLAFKAAYPVSVPNRWSSANSPTTETSFATSGIDCDDPSHDFAGTTGRPWCLSLSGDKITEVCKGTSDGKVTCLAQGVTAMPKHASSDPAKRTFIRSWAACDMTGKFVGWMCTTS